MEIIYLLIPLSLTLLGVAIWGFFWAVKSGQFDDLDSPGLSMLDDEPSDLKRLSDQGRT
jgi:cbb3-type cytochrome oxidase maturation protein